jgi:hypothetical protein
VTVDVDGQRVTARVSPLLDIAAGQLAWIEVDPQRVLLFQAESGKRR